MTITIFKGRTLQVTASNITPVVPLGSTISATMTKGSTTVSLNAIRSDESTVVVNKQPTNTLNLEQVTWLLRILITVPNGDILGADLLRDPLEVELYVKE